MKDQLQILSDLGANAKVEVLTHVPCHGMRFPIYGGSITLSTEANVPTFALIGGVHGLESIGSSVILSYLRSFGQYLSWDQETRDFLKRVKLAYLPLLNPAGTYLGQRSNGNGVDLMRNSPVVSNEKISGWHIYRGHRLTPFLPWYRGKLDEEMQLESNTLIDFVRREIFPSRFSICLDVHSGFGAVDRLWFPYAREKRFFPGIAEATVLKELLDRTLPNHIYRFEPQSIQYTVHGDLWDHIYDLHGKEHPDRIFLPLTLEMGSWNWLKKNPFQILSRQGIFHPIKEHRTRRVMRRHAPLFDFLARATSSWLNWIPRNARDRESVLRRALEYWPTGATD